MVDWSTLPEELLNFIAVRLFSLVELKRFRSICKSWRSSISGTDHRFPSRPLIHFNPIPACYYFVHICEPGALLSRASYFRVTRSSSTSKGWLIKSDVDINSGRFRLLQPVSRLPLPRPLESLDLLEFTVTEIQEAYAVLVDVNDRETAPEFSRAALVKVREGEDHHYGVLGVGKDRSITHWDRKVLRTKFEKMAEFSDIIVHNGLTYVVDSQGIVWLINSDLKISRYGPSLDHENITNDCYGEMRFVECCGVLHIVERLLKENPRKRKAEDVVFHYFITVGFKVYKMDEELGKWIEVKTLGDNAFIIDTEDTCFSVLATEFYGCVKNSIYYTEDCCIKMFKLDNGNGNGIS